MKALAVLEVLVLVAAPEAVMVAGVEQLRF